MKKRKTRRPSIARRSHELTLTRDCEDVYFTRNGGFYAIGFFVSLFMCVPWVYGVMYEESWRAAGVAACGIALLVLTNMLFKRLLPAPTALGHQAAKHLKGFRMYLETAEQNRLEAMHPPERTPALFEKYLPYAIALDVENEWGDQFRDVLALAAAGVAASAYQPPWYDAAGDSDDFSGSGFGESFSSSIGESLSQAAVPPPGSSSGFSSGSGGGSSFGGGYSGGGGSSGGGGGGGGGGGW